MTTAQRTSCFQTFIYVPVPVMPELHFRMMLAATSACALISRYEDYTTFLKRLDRRPTLNLRNPHCTLAL
jgi:hypothetical protein